VRIPSFDLLTKPEAELTVQERTQAKAAAEDVLEALKREKLVLNWRKRQQAKAQVELTIKQILDAELPPAYTRAMYEKGCAAAYQHVFESHADAGHSVYATVG